jgi:hypothetical protein
MCRGCCFFYVSNFLVFFLLGFSLYFFPRQSSFVHINHHIKQRLNVIPSRPIHFVMVVNAAKNCIIQYEISIFIRHMLLSLLISIPSAISEIQNMNELALVRQSYCKILHSQVSINIIKLMQFLNSIQHLKTN